MDALLNALLLGLFLVHFIHLVNSVLGPSQDDVLETVRRSSGLLDDDRSTKIYDLFKLDSFRQELTVIEVGFGEWLNFVSLFTLQLRAHF